MRLINKISEISIILENAKHENGIQIGRLKIWAVKEHY